ncbi:MAG: ABC transporter ATP-binding protein [Desulfuromonadales bacterium]|nr:ABC transporter ATP-binding protein [Desulfuromonadales bacterium]
MLTSVGLFARHLKGKGRLITAMFFLGLAGGAVSLAPPLIGKTFIDAVAERGDYAIVPKIAAALVALAVLDLILGAVTRLVHSRLSADVLVSIRERLFAHCLNSPLESLERFRHGDLLHRFGADVPKIQALLVDGVLGFFQNILFLIVAAVILLNLSTPMALWSFLGLGVALVITTAFRKPIENGTRGLREIMADLSHFLSERMSALRAIRLHASQKEEQKRFALLNAGMIRKMLRFQVLDSVASGTPGLALTASLAWIYLLGGRFLESGEIGLGTFVAFILYQGRLYGPAQGLLGMVRGFQEAQVSLSRISEVLAGEVVIDAATKEASRGGGELVVEKVSFTYPGNPPVLRQLDLKVAPGENVGIFGTSGAGKSTLVQVLFGLRIPQEGRILLGGEELGPNVAASAGGRLGYAGAEPFLLHATVEENLRYGNPEVTHSEMIDAACLAEAHTFILDLPDGYDTVIGGRGLSLSDGQRQRIGLARLALRNPDILVLDEAFSALDPETEALVRRNLWAAFNDRIILSITHRLGGLDSYDHLYLLRDGQLRKVGAKELNIALRTGRDGGINGGVGAENQPSSETLPKISANPPERYSA